MKAEQLFDEIKKAGTPLLVRVTSLPERGRGFDVPIGTQFYMGKTETRVSSFDRHLNDCVQPSCHYDIQWSDTWHEYGIEFDIIDKNYTTTEELKNDSFLVMINDNLVCISDKDNDCIEIEKKDIEKLIDILKKIK